MKLTSLRLSVRVDPTTPTFSEYKGGRSAGESSRYFDWVSRAVRTSISPPPGSAGNLAKAPNPPREDNITVELLDRDDLNRPLLPEYETPETEELERLKLVLNTYFNQSWGAYPGTSFPKRTERLTTTDQAGRGEEVQWQTVLTNPSDYLAPQWEDLIESSPDDLDFWQAVAIYRRLLRAQGKSRPFSFHAHVPQDSGMDVGSGADVHLSQDISGTLGSGHEFAIDPVLLEDGQLSTGRPLIRGASQQTLQWDVDVDFHVPPTTPGRRVVSVPTTPSRRAFRVSSTRLAASSPSRATSPSIADSHFEGVLPSLSSIFEEFESAQEKIRLDAGINSVPWGDDESLPQPPSPPQPAELVSSNGIE